MMNYPYAVILDKNKEEDIPVISKEQIEQFKQDMTLGLIESDWELISIGNDSKVYYDKERGMYKIEFSNGRSCVFDEY